jgi:hypothetical protein
MVGWFVPPVIIPIGLAILVLSIVGYHIVAGG